ncbi:protein sevenless-like [Camponotus floridanus]|uniref:protein sevenless-like n=1 Tax=Camponotus floridanus TaxID=104421 RepID=UPI000DC69360|nr:protein sevenless-like [Camponotus floridanus]
MNATANSINVTLPEPVVKKYELKFTLSNFYFDQLSINPINSNVISLKTNSGKLNAPENISVLALTPTIVVVHWMPPKQLNCVSVNYEVHWKLVNDTQQKSKQFINMPKRMADGRYFTKINLLLLVQDYLIYVRVYPINISDFYNESLSKIVHISSEPNNITLSEVNINSMNISWISNINLTISFTLEYKDIATEKWCITGKVKDLEKSGTEISVAIETLRKDASSREKEKLLKEAKLMNHFQHKHILRLLGICLDGDSPLLVLELMETGDLLKYLRECRNLQASDSLALRLQDLLAMCEDRSSVSQLFSIFEKSRERVIKIGDFGLARDFYKDDYYRVEGESLFLIRWMAPKSLIIRKFTSQSDVWSFGVLMWEITSLGEQPYSAKANEEVINYVRAGGRLPMTLNCPSPLYQLMLSCWSAADARPNFEFCLKNIIALRKNIEDALLSPVDII